MCNLYRHSGNSIGITVPKGIVEAQHLRPGMVVSVTIQKLPPRPKADAETETEGSR